MDNDLHPLKMATDALLQDLGLERSAKISGSSLAKLRGYTSSSAERADRFINVRDVAALEAAASRPHVTLLLAKLAGHTINLPAPEEDQTPISFSARSRQQEIVRVCEGFRDLMHEYFVANADHAISAEETEALLSAVADLQSTLITLKHHFSRAISDAPEDE